MEEEVGSGVLGAPDQPQRPHKSFLKNLLDGLRRRAPQREGSVKAAEPVLPQEGQFPQLPKYKVDKPDWSGPVINQSRKGK